MSSVRQRNVNFTVDKAIGLVEIPDVKPEWQTEHKIRALVVQGRSDAVAALEEWRRDNPYDYKKILKVMSLVGTLPRVRNENNVKRGKKYRDTYEMRAHKGHARLLFFYNQNGVVVCSTCLAKRIARPSQ